MNDKKVLIRNQLKIVEKTLKGHGFTQEEIDEINGRYNKEKYKTFRNFLLRDGGSERERLLADIYYATEIKNLERVNDFFDTKTNLDRIDGDLLKILNILGLIE